MSQPLVLAFYLPQFHPIPENDEWWGPGFTEWTNVAAARPLFPGHDQPHLPGALGFYDLRLSETRSQQAVLAADHGIDGFVYWHYWFDGHLLLQRPLEEVLADGDPALPFCVAWANHSWRTDTWTAVSRSQRSLIEQTYPGLEDHRRHFDYLLPFFSDHRYVRIDGRPLMYVREPGNIPRLEEFVELWQDLAGRNGLGGIHFVGEAWEDRPGSSSMDVVARSQRPTTLPVATRLDHRLRRRVLGHPVLREWSDYTERALQLGDDEWPVVFPNWDTTPRRGRSGTVLRGTSPSAFSELLARAVARARSLPDPQVLFVKSWNEWAEGNHLEPDRVHGNAWLDAVREAVRPTET